MKTNNEFIVYTAEAQWSSDNLIPTIAPEIN